MFIFQMKFQNKLILLFEYLFDAFIIVYYYCILIIQLSKSKLNILKLLINIT